MLSGIYNYFSGLMRPEYALNIPLHDLQQYSKQAKASEWHTFAIHKRPWRPHVCIPCAWIAESLFPQAHVFEVGCGSGANLFWLHKKGFTHLSGSDISIGAVDMCSLLSKHMGASVNVAVDDALVPENMPQNVDVLLSLNWLYHVPGASLQQLLELYVPCLTERGYMVFDTVDISYNNKRNNMYHTDDVGLPPQDRRPSEYTFRMSTEEVATCVAAFGFRIVRQKKLYTRPRRNIFMIQRRESPCQ